MDEETSPEDDQDKPSNPFSGLSGDIKDRIEEERIATQEGERQVALDFIRIFRVKEKISSLNGPRVLVSTATLMIWLLWWKRIKSAWIFVHRRLALLFPCLWAWTTRFSWGKSF